MSAIREATRAELAEHGYPGVTFEGVARRAKTSKPVLYRRYRSRAHMVVDAMLLLPRQPVPASEAPSLREDLMTLLDAIMARFDRIGIDTYRSLIGDADDELLETITAQLASGEMTMESVSAALGVSVATLRRRLEEEGTTFTLLVDEVRRDLAERHLSDPHRTISEVAFMLGFSHAPAFHKAFRRWTGATPSERRARLWT